jgi:serine/threonine protein kinase
VAFPVTRIETLGQGSSAVVYKSVMLNCLTVCAEKVVEVSDPSKRAQLRRELESLKQSQGFCPSPTSHSYNNTNTNNSNNNNSNNNNNNQGSRFIVRLLEVLSNPFDGTLSVCLEYLDGGTLQDVVRRGGCKDEAWLARCVLWWWWWWWWWW